MVRHDKVHTSDSPPPPPHYPELLLLPPPSSSTATRIIAPTIPGEVPPAGPATGDLGAPPPFTEYWEAKVVDPSMVPPEEAFPG